MAPTPRKSINDGALITSLSLPILFLSSSSSCVAADDDVVSCWVSDETCGCGGGVAATVKSDVKLQLLPLG